MTSNNELNIMSKKMEEEQNRLKELDKLTPSNQIKATTSKVVAGTIIATTLVSSVTPMSVFADNRLEVSNFKGEGFISVTEEVGPNGNGGIVSSGIGDYGGVSYGLCQLSTTKKSIDDFIENELKPNYPEFYKFFENAGNPGTEKFNKAWTDAYNYNPGKFEEIQIDYREKEFVNPAQEMILEELGIDMFATRARIELLHSTSVQHGATGMTNLLINAGVNKEMDEKELITTICDYKYKTVDTKFKSSSQRVRDTQRERYTREKEELLKIVKEEQGPSLEDILEGNVEVTEDITDEIVDTAKSYLNQGTTYKMGGKNTDKLDCSGYVSLVYQDIGLDVDEMMTNAGKFRNDSKTISREELKEGDLVFWHDLTGKKHAKVFHIGIYIGDDTVIDCSTDHNGVGTRKLSSLQDKEGDRYFTFGRYEALGNDKPKTIEISEDEEFTSVIEVDEEIKENSKLEEESMEDIEVTEEEVEIEDENSIIEVTPDTEEDEEDVEEENSIIDTDFDSDTEEEEDIEEENSIIEIIPDTEEDEEDVEEENSIIDITPDVDDEIEEDVEEENSIIDTDNNSDSETENKEEEDDSIVDTDNDTNSDSSNENTEEDDNSVDTDANPDEEEDTEVNTDNSETDTDSNTSNEPMEDETECNDNNDNSIESDDTIDSDIEENNSTVDNDSNTEENSNSDNNNEADLDNETSIEESDAMDKASDDKVEESSNDSNTEDNTIDNNDKKDSSDENSNSETNTKEELEENKNNKVEKEKTVDRVEENSIENSIESEYQLASNVTTDDMRIEEIKNDLENNNIFGKLAKMFTA